MRGRLLAAVVLTALLLPSALRPPPDRANESAKVLTSAKVDTKSTPSRP